MDGQRTVNWFKPKARIGIERGTVGGEQRFALIFTTDGCVLLDRAERVGSFSTPMAARFVADQRAGCVGVVHRSDSRSGQ